MKFTAGSLRTAAGLKQAHGGHVWGALHHPTVIGVAHVNATLAWDMWLEATLHTQASLYPDYWPGVWSSADYMRTDGTSGGSAFPLLNTHRHAWPLVSASNTTTPFSS